MNLGAGQKRAPETACGERQEGLKPADGVFVSSFIFRFRLHGFLAFRLLGFLASRLFGFFGFLSVYAAFGGFLASFAFVRQLVTPEISKCMLGPEPNACTKKTQTGNWLGNRPYKGLRVTLICSRPLHAQFLSELFGFCTHWFMALASRIFSNTSSSPASVLYIYVYVCVRLYVCTSSNIIGKPPPNPSAAFIFYRTLS